MTIVLKIGSNDFSQQWDGATAGLISGFVKLAAKGIMVVIGDVEITEGSDNISWGEERKLLVGKLQKLKPEEKARLAANLTALNNALDPGRTDSKYNLEKVLNHLKRVAIVCTEIQGLRGTGDVLLENLLPILLKTNEYTIEKGEKIEESKKPAEKISPYGAPASATSGTGDKEVAETFIRMFVQNADVQKVLKDKVIKINELTIPKELFDLIDNGMIVGSGNGKITLEEIKKFNDVLDTYARVICDGDRNKAIELYKNAKTFEMADLKAVEDASKDVASSFGITNSSTDQQIISSFGKLTEPCKAIITTYYTILKTSGITGQALINRLSLRLASLALVSQLDAASQKMILGVDVALPKYDGEITQDNISLYLSKELQEKKLLAEKREGATSEAKLDDPLSSEDENKIIEISKKMDIELKGIQNLDVEQQEAKKNEVQTKYGAQISDALKSKISLAEKEVTKHLLPALQDGSGALDPAVMSLQTVRGYAHRLAAEMLFRNFIINNNNKPVNLGVIKTEVSSDGSLKLLKNGKQECTVAEAIKLLIEKSGTGKQVFDISIIEAIGKRFAEAQLRPASRPSDSTVTHRRKKGNPTSQDSSGSITRKPKAQQKTSAQAAKKLFGG